MIGDVKLKNILTLTGHLFWLGGPRQELVPLWDLGVLRCSWGEVQTRCMLPGVDV